MYSLICRKRPILQHNDVQESELETISIIWSVEDVLNQRPDLTEKQSIKVLEQIKICHNAEIGVTWETIDTVAEDLYPS